MQIVVSARHQEVPEQIRTYATDKAARLQRYYDRIQSIEVVFDAQSGHQLAELIVHIDHSHPLVVRESHADQHAAVDQAIDLMAEQLRRHKERLRNRKHPDTDRRMGE